MCTYQVEVADGAEHRQAPQVVQHNVAQMEGLCIVGGHTHRDTTTIRTPQSAHRGQHTRGHDRKAGHRRMGRRQDGWEWALATCLTRNSQSEVANSTITSVPSVGKTHTDCHRSTRTYTGVGQAGDVYKGFDGGCEVPSGGPKHTHLWRSTCVKHSSADAVTIMT